MEMGMEERIKNLENRIKKLEEKERRRQIIGIIKTVIIIALYVAIIAYGVYLYKEFSEKLEPIISATEKTDEWKSIFDEYFK